MEQFVDINQIVEGCSSHDNLEQVLKLYSDNFVNNDYKAVASCITNLLGIDCTRHEGLIHLATLLPRGSSDVILENGTIWMVSCIKACENKDSSIRNLAYRSLASLITIMSNSPDFLKSVSNNSINKLLDCIMQDESLSTSLYCLEVCIKYVPGACGPHKSNLERYLLNFLKELDKGKVILSAKCIHLLQQTSGGGVKGINHKCNWEKQFRMTINSLHSLMDVIYANVMETVVRSNDELCLQMPAFNMPDNPVHQVAEISKRFNNLCCFLQIMLTEPFPVAKRVQPDLVLHLINRGLGVTSKALTRVSTDNIILNAFLPDIHESLLKTLDALLFCVGRHLSSYAPIICKIVLRVLQWTQDIVAPSHRKIRLSAYESLINWMKVSNLSSFVEQHESEIICAIMFDITPQKSSVKLENQKGINEHEQHSEVQNLNKFEENKTKSCSLALECFQKVLSSSGLFFKPLIQKNLQSTVASIILRIQSGEYTNTVYNKNVKCRKLLYQVLFSLILHPSSRFPPPTHEGVIIFSQGQLDSDSDIAHLCGEMLCTIKKIIHTNSLNRDENKGIALNQLTPEETASEIMQPNSDEKLIIPPTEEPIILDSTDFSNSDAEVESTEIFNTQDSVKSTNDTLENPISPQNNFVEPDAITPVNINSIPMNGTITNNDSDSPPVSDEVCMMDMDDLDAIPSAKRQKLMEDDVPLPSCEEIVASVKEVQQNNDKIVMNDIKIESAKNDIIINEEQIHPMNMLKIEKVETVTIGNVEEVVTSEDTFISAKLPENAAANLSVEEMMSSFVSEINDDI